MNLFVPQIRCNFSFFLGPFSFQISETGPEGPESGIRRLTGVDGVEIKNKYSAN